MFGTDFAHGAALLCADAGRRNAPCYVMYPVKIKKRTPTGILFLYAE